MRIQNRTIQHTFRNKYLKYGSASGSTIINNGGGYNTSNGKTNLEYINVKDYNAYGDGNNDDTIAIQNAIDNAYRLKKLVFFPCGTYIVTQSLWVYDGIEIKGSGIYNTIIKTPFAKTNEAKDFVTRDAGKGYCTLTNPSNVPTLNTRIGHNRFYIGNGVEGYYDSDRDTNPNHPLYWANDGSSEFKKWKADRDKIVLQGRWIGKTGREGYGGAVFKSSQKPDLKYEDYENPTKTNPKGTIHTGIRNVKFSDLQINTNSSDRGKDSAIDFQYKASNIPSAIRETYDSSVLNVQLYNLYLFSLGKSGYRATRAVDHTIIGCYVRQCAEQGFYIDGVTSIFFTGCYTNSCIEGGYVLRGCNYSSLSSCASDSCSIGYNLYNCNGISLNGCGCEATRYQKGEEGVEDPYKGRAYVIRNCKGISLTSCYTMTSHPKVYLDEVLDVTDEELDPNWLKSRHIFVQESQNVQISYCYFKCFERIRSTPYRDADNNKVNYQGGTYDPSIAGSRYWQVQNYLVGAQFEIRGESCSVHIIGGETKDSLSKQSEIRTGNLDLLDPGTVVNPLAGKGYSTAGKTMSGGDGNGGWYRTNADGTTDSISMENFEFVFPMNAKSVYGVRDYFWEWRNSLILVRKFNDEKLSVDYPNKYYGYMNVLGTESAIDWGSVTDTVMNLFRVDIINDYSKTSFIDGSKDLFSFGKFSWQQLDAPIAFEPSIFSPIPAFVRDKPEGNRLTLNANDISGFPTEVNKASVSVIGNKNMPATETTEAIEAGSALAILSRRKSNEMADKSKVMFITNLDGSDLLSVYEKNERNKAISIKDRELISTDMADYSYIAQLAPTATSTQVINAINSLINRLLNHGLIIEPTGGGISFNSLGISDFDETNATIKFSIENTGTDIIYKAGLAYSTTVQTPVYSNNNVEAVLEGTDYSCVLSYGTANVRYVRFYCETDANGGESSRKYSDQTYVLYYSNNLKAAQFVKLEDYVPEIPEVGKITFNNVAIKSYEGSQAVISFDVINTTSDDIYSVGAAYSSSNTTPTYSNNHADATLVETGTYNVTVTYGTANLRYIRFYANTSADTSESSRKYSDTYKMIYDGNTATIEQYL